MTIKQLGGIFGRNPTFEDVTIEGTLTFDGDIDVNSDLKVSGDIETTGNVIIATSGKGIDFSATSGTGSSELFDDYEEGAVTNPLYVGSTQITSGYSVNGASYTKVGDTVIMNIYIDYTSPAGTGPTGNVTIGLPFTPTNSAILGRRFICRFLPHLMLALFLVLPLALEQLQLLRQT